MVKFRRFKFTKLPKKPLPNSISGWIDTSVEDALALSKLPKFRLNMGSWNSISNLDGKCTVCLGGAVIVGRGLVTPGEDLNGQKTEHIAKAMNLVRVGLIRASIPYFVAAEAIPKWLGENLPDSLLVEITQIEAELNDAYAKDRTRGRAEWPAYRKCAKKLRELGL